MNTEKLKTNFTSWNTVDKLYSISGPILALHASKTNDVEYSTFYVNNSQNIVTKCWQYEFGLSLGFHDFNPHIFYWKSIEDINFNELQWSSIKDLPDVKRQIIGWVNTSNLIGSNGNYKHYQLTTLPARLHFGYFEKHWFGKYLGYHDYDSIPWKKVFRWCYVDDLFINEINEDARKLPIQPSLSIDYEFIKKQYA